MQASYVKESLRYLSFLDYQPLILFQDYIESWLPPTIFGILPLIGAALCLLLPETAGCILPDTLQDGEEFGK